MESLSYTFEGRGLLFTDDAIETVGFARSISPNMTRKSSLRNQFMETYRDDTGDHSGGKSVISSSSITLNSLMEFGTRLSCSVNNKANDEKLADSSESTRHGTRVSTDNSELCAKRARITNLQSQVPTCQVLGCNKDLSFSKDYHKRHKVCDVHSKTAVVIVNGIKQRFCQQCSRFHILAEFDEGKRSCRKRLAGHNERRRKPQFNTHLGSSYFTDASKTSMLFSGILPSNFLGLQCNEPTNHIARLKLENEQSQLSQLAFHMKLNRSLPQSILHLHDNIGKQYPILSVPESSAGLNSSRACSLLSVQSQNSLSNSAGNISQENYQTTLGTVQNPVSDDSVDLIELSLHLQRVEQQKYYSQVKLENGVFCQSTTT